MDANTKGEQPLHVDLGRSCPHLLPNEQGQDQLDSHHQRTYAKVYEVKCYHYPYAILISKFLNFFEVNLQEELTKVVKGSHEINNGSLSKMGFTKIGGKWVNKDGDQVGSSSGAHAEDGDEEQTDVVVDGGGAGFQAREEDVGPSVGIMGDRITSITPFERLVLRRMNDLADEQRSHHEFCVARF